MVNISIECSNNAKKKYIFFNSEKKCDKFILLKTKINVLLQKMENIDLTFHDFNNKKMNDSLIKIKKNDINLSQHYSVSDDFDVVVGIDKNHDKIINWVSEILDLFILDIPLFDLIEELCTLEENDKFYIQNQIGINNQYAGQLCGQMLGYFNLILKDFINKRSKYVHENEKNNIVVKSKKLQHIISDKLHNMEINYENRKIMEESLKDHEAPIINSFRETIQIEYDKGFRFMKNVDDTEIFHLCILDFEYTIVDGEKTKFDTMEELAKHRDRTIEGYENVFRKYYIQVKQEFVEKYKDENKCDIKPWYLWGKSNSQKEETCNKCGKKGKKCKYDVETNKCIQDDESKNCSQIMIEDKLSNDRKHIKKVRKECNKKDCCIFADGKCYTKNSEKGQKRLKVKEGLNEPMDPKELEDWITIVGNSK